MTPKEQAILTAYQNTPALQAAGGTARNNEDIAAAINALPEFDGEALTMANPAPQGTVLAPLTMPGLLALVASDIDNLIDSPTFKVWAKGLAKTADLFAVMGALSLNPADRDFIEVASYLISVGDRPALKAFARLLFADSKLSEASKDAVIVAVDATIDDPNYQATVANPNRQFVIPEEVQSALN